MPLICSKPLAASPQGLGTPPTTTMRRPSRFIASSALRYWKLIVRELDLRHQHRRAGGAPAFKIPVGVGGAGERISLADHDAYLAGAHRGKQLARGLGEFLARGDVVKERRAGEEQRAAFGELERTDGGRRTGGIAESHHHP